MFAKERFSERELLPLSVSSPMTPPPSNVWLQSSHPADGPTQTHVLKTKPTVLSPEKELTGGGKKT